MSRSTKAAGVAWLITAVYYFYQYTLRSAPAAMMRQLSEAFGLSAMGVASMLGLFYWGYSPFSLVAGAALDRLGPRKVVPLGAAAVGVASMAATLIGATQMFGMAGGSAGQFVVGPLIGAGVPWSRFWLFMGVAGLVIGALLYLLLPAQESSKQCGDWLKAAAVAIGSVLRNPQSILCGAIAGLLFIPTTIFDMTWGVRYLQDARGHEFATAVVRSATVPLGWIVGCPLLGFVSDRRGRRKPVILAGALVLLAALAWILHGPTDVLPPALVPQENR